MKLNPTEQIIAYCLARRHPMPVREYQFAAPVRAWAFDLAWPALKVAIEVDGAVFTRGRHTSGFGFMADCDKLNEAVFRGWRVIRVTPTHFRNGQALGWVDRLLPVPASI